MAIRHLVNIHNHETYVNEKLRLRLDDQLPIIEVNIQFNMDIVQKADLFYDDKIYNNKKNY